MNKTDPNPSLGDATTAGGGGGARVGGWVSERNSKK